MSLSWARFLDRAAAIPVTAGIRLCVAVACVMLPPIVAQAAWKAVEKVDAYPIAGTSGPELYASIGERGPKVSLGRAIAYTNFKLTWSRKYENQGGACVLVSALPKLTITYTLPKPSKQLPAKTARDWETFITGVRNHELVHGDMIKDLVGQIEAATVGLSVAGDPDCRKIKTEMTKRLSALSLAQRQKSRDFDKTEMSDGGNIHQLILGLVNGAPQ
jgi:predicted secreted Zn-dependent protease